MIKKNTKMIFEGEEEKELMGGVPLSEGETITVIENGTKSTYKVAEKSVTFNMVGEDQIADIVYRLKKEA